MKRQRYSFVMAIYPNTRGFAFVLFEGPLSPVDWQAVEIRQACSRNGYSWALVGSHGLQTKCSSLAICANE
jgi:hypothetical protein